MASEAKEAVNTQAAPPAPIGTEESKALQELNKFSAVRDAVAMYKGVMGNSDYARAVADKVEGTVTSLGQSVLKTDAGKTVDDLLAKVTSTSRSAISSMSSPQEEEQDGNNPQPGLCVRLFHLWFRFFPVLLLFRWGVDIALALTEMFLAMVKDFVRMGPHTVLLHTPNAFVKDDPYAAGSTTGNRPKRGAGAAAAQPGGQASTSDPRADETETLRRNLRPRHIQSDGPIHAAKSIVLYFVLVGYYFSKMFFIYVAIPVLSIQFLVLDAISSTLHHLAGISDDKSDAAIKETEREEREMLGSGLIPFVLNRNMWLTDLFLERTARSFARCPVGAAILKEMGVARPVGVTKKLYILLSKLSSQNGTQGALAPYLNLDNTYHEEEDPGFEPVDEVDTADDSMLETDTERNGTDGGENAYGKHLANGKKESEEGPTEYVSFDNSKRDQPQPVNGDAASGAAAS